jgi:hypothetical protein|tara:strand:+ start:91 stop:408 length:318 start_codon:yes stop_codon:yes gene_type:complete
MIKLKDILLEQEMPTELYHSVTDDYVRDFVMQNGIKANDQNFVYLSEKPITKPPFKYTFKVKIPNMDELFDWRDMHDEGPEHQYDKNNPYYIYNNDIPKQYVKLI